MTTLITAAKETTVHRVKFCCASKASSKKPALSNAGMTHFHYCLGLPLSIIARMLLSVSGIGTSYAKDR